MKSRWFKTAAAALAVIVCTFSCFTPAYGQPAGGGASATYPTTPATQPVIAAPITKTYPLYWSGNVTDVHARVPTGTISMMTDGGGRFDNDLNTAGYQENTFWVGDYWGVGGTPNNPSADRMTTFDWPDVYKFCEWLPKAYFYSQDIETWPLDIRTSPDKEVQKSLDKLNAWYDTVQTVRPDVTFGFYAGVPMQEFWVMTNYQMAINAYDKWKRGEKLTDTGAGNEVWAISGVFNRSASGYYKFDTKKAWTVQMQQWVDASYRMTYNVDATGKKIATTKSPGFASRLRVFCPPLYKFYDGDPVVTDNAQIMWNIALAKRMSDGKKPVIPFVWPHLHNDRDGVHYPYLSLTDWRSYIRLVFKHGADGLILWGFDAKTDQAYIDIVLEESEYARRQPASYFTDWKKLPWPDSFVP